MKIIGHGGAKALAPENTTASFEQALENNVDEVEFDVRLSKDHQPVLIHDPEITATDGRTVRVADTSYAELSQLIPNLATLTDAIEYIGHKAIIHAEIKPGVPTAEIADCVKMYLTKGWKPSEFVFASFDQRPLVDLKQRLPEISSVVLEDWFTHKALRRAEALGTKRICMMENWLYPAYIRMIAKRGYKLYCYPCRSGLLKTVSSLFGLVGTCNDPARANKWAAAGLAGVVTDYPDRYAAQTDV
jgi:glycerophosphoryl diester phosphodiesterase